jgi:hypothetical protein
MTYDYCRCHAPAPRARLLAEAITSRKSLPLESLEPPMVPEQLDVTSRSATKAEQLSLILPNTSTHGLAFQDRLHLVFGDIEEQIAGGKAVLVLEPPLQEPLRLMTP